MLSVSTRILLFAWIKIYTDHFRLMSYLFIYIVKSIKLLSRLSDIYVIAILEFGPIRELNQRILEQVSSR